MSGNTMRATPSPMFVEPTTGLAPTYEELQIAGINKVAQEAREFRAALDAVYRIKPGDGL